MTIEEVENLKPIPKYIMHRIEKLNKTYFAEPDGHVRFYAYLTMWKRKELMKITVAVKHYRKKLYMKQVAVHALHGVRCFVKDMEYCSYLAMGYKVGWYDQGITKCEKWYESRGWAGRRINTMIPMPISSIMKYSIAYRNSSTASIDKSASICFLSIYASMNNTRRRKCLSNSGLLSSP